MRLFSLERQTTNGGTSGRLVYQRGLYQTQLCPPLFPWASPGTMDQQGKGLLQLHLPWRGVSLLFASDTTCKGRYAPSCLQGHRQARRCPALRASLLVAGNPPASGHLSRITVEQTYFPFLKLWKHNYVHSWQFCRVIFISGII